MFYFILKFLFIYILSFLIFNFNTSINNYNKLNLINSISNSSYLYHQDKLNSISFDSVKQKSSFVPLNYDEFLQNNNNQLPSISLFDSFFNILEISEGVHHYFYLDNKGVALGYGWNLSENSVKFNLNIAQNLNFNYLQFKSIKFFSNNLKIKKIPKEFKHIYFSKSQLKNISKELMPIFEFEFINSLANISYENNRNFSRDLFLYDQLPNNQKAVLIHMAYKVGFNNLNKYSNFYNSLFNYFDSPTEYNLNLVLDNITYTYKLKGNLIHDHRVENIHKDYFQKCIIKYNENKILNDCYN